MIEFYGLLDAPAKATFWAAVAAFLSVIATALSAFAALRGPLIAARLADELRQKGEKSFEKRQVKLQVFGTLMRYRSTYYSGTAVEAFNLIDVAFIENRNVRDAWAELYNSFDASKRIPEHEKNKRYRMLLIAMASDLGLADGLRLDDFERVYHPTALAEEEQLRILQRQNQLRHLIGDTSPTANAAAPTAVNSHFPPRPNG